MDIKKEFLEKVDKTNDQISASPIIKGLVDGLISLVPFIGSAISSSLDTRAFQLFEENSRRFAEETREILEKIEEKKIDKNFLESKEFTSLLIEILGITLELMKKKKLNYLQNYLLGFQLLKE